jgi:hypothetical protein
MGSVGAWIGACGLRHASGCMGVFVRPLTRQWVYGCVRAAFGSPVGAWVHGCVCAAFGLPVVAWVRGLQIASACVGACGGCVREWVRPGAGSASPSSGQNLQRDSGHAFPAEAAQSSAMATSASGLSAATAGCRQRQLLPVVVGPWARI